MTIGDIVNKVYFITKANSTSYASSDMQIAINVAQNRVASLIMEADSRWQWDDTNQTDLPIATTALVSGQQDYSLALAYLTVDRIEILDTTNNWTALKQIDQQLLKGDRQMALGMYQNVPSTPAEYDLVANSIFLYPAPNYSLSSAMKVYFTRGPVDFSSSDISTGTKVPGFNALFHELIPLWVSYDYAVANPSVDPKLAPSLMGMIQLKETELREFYALRNRDVRPRFRASTDSNR